MGKLLTQRKGEFMNALKRILVLFAAVFVCSLVPQTAFGQTEKLGIVKYTPPKGWTKTTKENVVIFSVLNQATGGYCFITLYGATPGTGNPQKDFAREWNNRVVEPFGAEASPKTEAESADGWTGIAGGSAIEFQGAKSTAFLTVYSRGEITFSVLGISNDESYLARLVAFVSAIEIDKTVADNAAPRPAESSAPSPATSTTMHVAALVREFETNEVRANQTYIGRRVRVTGTVNTIEVDRGGQIILTFKTSVSTYRMGRCYFNKSQSARVGALNAHEQATVEGTVKGLGDGFDNSKAFLVLENCTVP
jgi:hypothetical protein